MNITDIDDKVVASNLFVKISFRLFYVLVKNILSKNLVKNILWSMKPFWKL